MPVRRRSHRGKRPIRRACAAPRCRPPAPIRLAAGVDHGRNRKFLPPTSPCRPAATPGFIRISSSTCGRPPVRGPAFAICDSLRGARLRDGSLATLAHGGGSTSTNRQSGATSRRRVGQARVNFSRRTLRLRWALVSIGAYSSCVAEASLAAALPSQSFNVGVAEQRGTVHPIGVNPRSPLQLASSSPTLMSKQKTLPSVRSGVRQRSRPMTNVRVRRA